MSTGRVVQLRVGGQSYRVVTSASEHELEHLAGLVEEKLRAVAPAGRPLTPNTLLLAAIALAHDLERERERVAALKSKARTLTGKLLEQVDGALGSELDR